MTTAAQHNAFPPESARTLRRDQLSLALMDARNFTLQLLARFEAALAEGPVLPDSPEVEPPAWIAGHIAWLAEYWIARNPQRSLGPRCPADGVRLASIEPMADGWFNPLLAPPAARRQLALPDMQAVRAYMLDTHESTIELLDKAQDTDDALHFFRAVLMHEDARCEQLLVMAQTLGLALPMPPPAAIAQREALLLPATRWPFGGSSGQGFSFDIERPMHAVAVPEFEIDAQPVSWSQYVEFVDDGGYDRSEFWQPEGWAWLQAMAQREGRRGPRHVEQIGMASGAVMQTLFGKPSRMAGAQPAMHLSWWEADAWARWAGRRLPAEVEWEVAAHAASRRGFLWGEVHEWCANTIRPWDGWQPEGWTRGGPFDPQPVFGQARVRRGASFATRARMKHPRQRGFALPERDDGFVGFRSCAL